MPGAVGLLVMRTIDGAALMLHGWPKLQSPSGWMPPGSPYPVLPQGAGRPRGVWRGLALILGQLTPIAAFGILCTMAVATFSHISRGDPFVAGEPGMPSLELAATYFGVACAWALTGPGRLSLDALLFASQQDG